MFFYKLIFYFNYISELLDGFLHIKVKCFFWKDYLLINLANFGIFVRFIVIGSSLKHILFLHNSSSY
jgi:hypothetical protein